MRRDGGVACDVLFSRRYGIPITKANPTTPISTIGFLNRVSGETIVITH